MFSYENAALYFLEIQSSSNKIFFKTEFCLLILTSTMTHCISSNTKNQKSKETGTRFSLLTGLEYSVLFLKRMNVSLTEEILQPIETSPNCTVKRRLHSAKNIFVHLANMQVYENQYITYFVTGDLKTDLFSSTPRYGITSLRVIASNLCGVIFLLHLLSSTTELCK